MSIDLKAARHALGLSAERFSRLGETIGVRIAESGRTVRRWESGERPVPGTVQVLVHLLLTSSAAREILGVSLKKPAE